MSSVEELGSQELPLSQETFSYGWDNIPAIHRDVLCSDNFNIALTLGEMLPSAFTENNVRLQSATIPVVPANVPQSSLPSTEDFPGFMNFTVNVPVNEAASKNSTYVCSSMLQRLYIRKDSPCAFNFSVNEHIKELIEPSFVRATLFYSSPENINNAVIRCVNHRLLDSEKGDSLSEHLLRSESRSAQYFKDSVTNRCSVLVPFENPPIGQNFSTYVYKFLCYTSCSGGPNRRPLCVVFTLENKNLIMGRKKIDVRVCSCPFRDKTLDESKLQNTSSQMLPPIRYMPVSSDSSLSDITNDCKTVSNSIKRKKDDSSSGEEKEYIIKVQGKARYRYLKAVNTYYGIVETFKLMKNNNWVPTEIDAKNLFSLLTSSSES